MRVGADAELILARIQPVTAAALVRIIVGSEVVRRERKLHVLRIGFALARFGSGIQHIRLGERHEHFARFFRSARSIRQTDVQLHDVFARNAAGVRHRHGNADFFVFRPRGVLGYAAFFYSLAERRVRQAVAEGIDDVVVVPLLVARPARFEVTVSHIDAFLVVDEPLRLRGAAHRIAVEIGDTLDAEVFHGGNGHEVARIRVHRSARRIHFAAQDSSKRHDARLSGQAYLNGRAHFGREVIVYRGGVAVGM